MPQLITKQINVNDHPLSDGALAELPGLGASILTGSGWIFTTIGVPITMNAAGSAAIEMVLAVDGAIAHPDSSAYFKTNMSQYQMIRLIISHAARIGAGQHILQVFANTSEPGPFVVGYSAHMQIHELGF